VTAVGIQEPTVSVSAVPSPPPGVRAVERLRRVCCGFHCGGCGRHFASLEAFDLHRDGPWTARRCEDPNDVVGKTPRTRLQPKDTDGICAMGEDEVHGVTVWQTEAANEAGRKFE